VTIDSVLLLGGGEGAEDRAEEGLHGAVLMDNPPFLEIAWRSGN